MTDSGRRTSGLATRPSAGWRRGDASDSRAFVVASIHGEERPHRLHSTTPDHSRGREALDLPCRRADPELWFAAAPADLEKAKALCAGCPVRQACLAVAVHRVEYTGVWGGHIFEHGRIVPHKRSRGRPRKNATTGAQDVITDVAAAPTHGPTRMHAAARRLYDAECALGAAQQTRVAARVDTAVQALRDAVTEYLAAAADDADESGRRQSAS
jgi:WhiB family redox-sensing transcriptional regulator